MVSTGPAKQILQAFETAAPHDPTIAALLAHGRLMRDRHALNQLYLAQLRESIAAPLTEIAMRFAALGNLTPPDITAIAEQLAAKLAP